MTCRSLRGTVLGLLTLLSMLKASDLAAQSIQIRQASWDDSLVTVADINHACTRLNRLPLLVDVAKSNLKTAAATEEATARTNVTMAEKQLNEWNALFNAQDGDVLKQFCAATGHPNAWRLTKLPSRRDIKRANSVTIAYNPFAENLSGTGVAGFLGLDESAIVNGIAKFLVDRAAAEVQIAFIERIKTVACDPMRKPVFESTCIALDQAQLQLNAALMKELRSAAEQDVRRAPRSVPLAFITHNDAWRNIGSPASPILPRQQDFVLSAYLIGGTIEQMLNGADPLAAMSASLDADIGAVARPDSGGLFLAALSRKESGISLPVSASLYRLALVSRILPDSDADGHPEWPTNPAARTYFVKALAVNGLAWLSELGLADAASVAVAENVAGSLALQLEDTRARATAIRKELGTLKGNDSAVVANVAKLVDDGLALGQSWAELLDRLGNHRDTAVVRTIQDIRVIASGIAAREYARAAVGMYTLTSRSATFNLKVPSGTTELVSFVTASASATSSSEFASMLESFAAPVQSYRTKRATKSVYFVVNGYVGAGSGWERSNGGTSGYLGVAAPVGIELGWGDLGHHQWSFGVMAQAIDVGALASYRLNASKEDLESDPKVGFSQVLSPGGYAVLGFPKVPLSLGIGGNIAPQLRKVNGTNETKNAGRLGFMLGIDVPIFVFR